MIKNKLELFFLFKFVKLMTDKFKEVILILMSDTVFYRYWLFWSKFKLLNFNIFIFSVEQNFYFTLKDFFIVIIRSKKKIKILKQFTPPGFIYYSISLKYKQATKNRHPLYLTTICSRILLIALRRASFKYSRVTWLTLKGLIATSRPLQSIIVYL